MLVDTSVLARLLQPEHPDCETAREAIKALVANGKPLCVASQNLVELWVVATRPIAANGLGLSARDAANELARIRSMFPVLIETADAFARWERIVVENEVLGKQAHDARIVAMMAAHGLGEILTFDSDFDRYSVVRSVAPRSVSQTRPDRI